jgi:hypothetical protein
MVHVPVDPPCDDCEERLPSEPGTACYHHDFVEGELLKSYHQNAQQIVASLTRELTPPGRIRCHLHLSEKSIAADCTTDLSCVDFEPETLEQSMTFSDFLKDYLVVRGMSRFANLEERREALGERMIQERHLEDLRNTFDHCARHPEALVDVMKLIPGILHLEIRCGIHIFSMVLARGLDSANNQPEFVKNLEEIMRKHILGSDDHPVDWFFPAQKEKINNNGETNGRRNTSRLVLGDVRMTMQRD